MHVAPSMFSAGTGGGTRGVTGGDTTCGTSSTSNLQLVFK